ncbi:MAG: AAA family ATPase [Candidatus Sumerlaeota bacterium]|nr:AAA family ATPase [Candidatus Sumerlaeota bacterium]
MITRFRVQNYKCLRDVTLDLTPIHVLIGPNDSGKTSILEAIAALCRSVDHKLSDAFLGPWEGRELVWHGEPEAEVCFIVSCGSAPNVPAYRLPCRFEATDRDVRNARESISLHEESHLLAIPADPTKTALQWASMDQQTEDKWRVAAESVVESISGVHLCRWYPKLLAVPAALEPERPFQIEPYGFGLGRCLDDILSHDHREFTSLEDEFRGIFKQVKAIRLKTVRAYSAPVDDPEQVPLLQRSPGKGIEFVFGGNPQPVNAAQASDGMLLTLAFLTVLHLPQPPRVLLIEEPENGVHPKRLQEVMRILRGLVKEHSQTQVILTTHSPYLLDLFEPEEVTLCKREDDGSISVHRLSESEAVRQQLDIFNLGEIWSAEGDERLARDCESKGEPKS